MSIRFMIQQKDEMKQLSDLIAEADGARTQVRAGIQSRRTGRREGGAPVLIQMTLSVTIRT